jgi:serine/threonine-protein kinase
MTDDDSIAATIPDTAAPTHGARPSGAPARSPDDRYVLQTLLGKGGMGEVWLAHDLRIDRDIAIKMMRGSGDPESTARFLREARVQGRLEHPSVVPVHDLGGDGGEPYFAMKRLTGTTLADVLSRDDAEWTRRKLLARFVEICLAVEFAHQRGVIHRDLKPANIMLGDFGETYVLDWGLARIASSEPHHVAPISAIETGDLRSDSGSGGQTKVGAMLGTPGYMAPEQMRGEAIDQRADVFSLGCILFEILARTPAIPRDQSYEVTLGSEQYRPATRRPDADIPPELDDACARATSADRTLRPSSARALADEVQRFLDGDRDLERRRELAAEHAGRATAAVARESEEARVEAMREAGRAIAIDPRNREAQELLAKLLLEPPKRMPAEAARNVELERQVAAQTVFRLGARSYLANFLMVPVVKLLGVGGTWPFVIISALVLFQVGACYVLARKVRPVNMAMFAVVVGGHTLLLTASGVFFGSLLFVPMFAFGSLPIMLMLPSIRLPKWATAMHLLAVFAPVVLELLHVVPSTFTFRGNELVLRPVFVTASPQLLVGILLAIITVQMIVTTLVLDGQRQKQDRAQELLHIQSWQLGKLVTTNE